MPVNANESHGSHYGSIVILKFFTPLSIFGPIELYCLVFFKFGFIYVFNIIVGTGALTMPKAFETAGYLLSTVLIIFLNVLSYITGTFMIEAMAIANSVKNLTKDSELNVESYSSLMVKSSSRTSIHKNTTVNDASINNEAIDEVRASDVEERPLVLHADEFSDEEFGINNRNSNNNNNHDTRNDLLKQFDIKTKFEMGEMAAMFFNRFGLYCFYVSIILYLYGDLAIYDAAVPKSLRDTTCTYYPANVSDNDTIKLNESDPCWSHAYTFLTRMNVYRIYVLLFNLLIGGLVFYNVQKTKFLQLCTTIMRWFAFITMIVLATKRILDNKPGDVNVKSVNIRGVPNFFGICIYAFMCHHSLPSIITPIKNKHTFRYIFFLVYICILCFYLVLSYTGLFAFGENLNDFYTLNFEPKYSHANTDGLLLTIVDYYLSLFPVFTISASFPIIAITLRNNLVSIHKLYTNGSPSYKRNAMMTASSIIGQETSNFVFYAYPLITLIPPLIISLITHDLQLLVGITGSYAGVTIQYVFPALLVYFGRRESIRLFRVNYQNMNPNRSPFMSRYWVYFVLLWSNMAVAFVTVNYFI